MILTALKSKEWLKLAQMIRFNPGLDNCPNVEMCAVFYERRTGKLI